VGARRGYKNFDALLAAYHDTALFKALDLLIIGGAPLTAAESELIKKLGLAGCVIHVQLASDELLAEAYSKARFLVYPSLYEGFGLPPIEAMAAGCPVVACRTSAMPEVCLDAPFYFEPKDPSSLGRAIVNANEDEDARRCAIQRGRDVAVTYSWAECANRTLAVYRDCCGEATG
jgi:glycosyltransferase involved in cell wall biosynthesis